MKLDDQSLNGFRNCKSLCCCLCVYRGALEHLKYIKFKVKIKNMLIYRIIQLFNIREKMNEIYLDKTFAWAKEARQELFKKNILLCFECLYCTPGCVCGTCKEWRDLLCPDPLQQVNQQLSANRNARHQLELDLENKLSALSIDHTAHNLHNNSRCSNNSTLEC